MSFQNETTMNIIENQASPYKLRKTSFSVCVPHGFSYDYLLFIDIMDSSNEDILPFSFEITDPRTEEVIYSNIVNQQKNHYVFHLSLPLLDSTHQFYYTTTSSLYNSIFDYVEFLNVQNEMNTSPSSSTFHFYESIPLSIYCPFQFDGILHQQESYLFHLTCSHSDLDIYLNKKPLWTAKQYLFSLSMMGIGTNTINLLLSSISCSSIPVILLAFWFQGINSLPLP